MNEAPEPRVTPTPVATYAVVARPEHVEAMADAVSSPRWFGPLPWFTVIAGTWFGLMLAMNQLPEWLRVRPLLGWPVVVAGGALLGWLSARLGRWVVRRKMRDLLVARGWGVGTEHVAEHGDGWFALRGPASQVHVDAADVRRVHEGRGAVVVLTTDGPPVMSVAELFPGPEVERLRRAAAGPGKT